MNDHYKAGAYRNWATENGYMLASGRFVLPVAEMPPSSSEDMASWSPVEVVQAHAPYALRSATFSATKEGTPPTVPSPQSSGPFTFLEGVISCPGPETNQSGNKFNWTVGGQYLFVQTLRSDPASDGLILTGTPFPLEIQRQNAINYPPSDNVTGPVAEAGNDVKTGYSQAQTISEGNPYWQYNTLTLFPPQLFDGNMVKGGA